MYENKNNENYLKNLYELCSAIFKCEELFKNNSYYNDIEGYFIEKVKLEELKQNIFYDKIKSKCDLKNGTYKSLIDKFKNKKKLDENKRIEIHINNVTFKNGAELIKSLNNDKKYYLISQSLWFKICKNNQKSVKGIKFSLEENNIIYISIKKKNNYILK